MRDQRRGTVLACGVRKGFQKSQHSHRNQKNEFEESQAERSVGRRVFQAEGSAWMVRKEVWYL